MPLTTEERDARLEHVNAMISMLEGILQNPVMAFQQASMEGRQYINWAPDKLRAELGVYYAQRAELSRTASRRFVRIMPRL